MVQRVELRKIRKGLGTQRGGSLRRRPRQFPRGQTQLRCQQQCSPFPGARDSEGVEGVRSVRPVEDRRSRAGPAFQAAAKLVEAGAVPLAPLLSPLLSRPTTPLVPPAAPTAASSLMSEMPPPAHHRWRKREGGTVAEGRRARMGYAQVKRGECCFIEPACTLCTQ